MAQVHRLKEPEQENDRLKRRRAAIGHVREILAVVSERRACRGPGQVRRTQRYTLKVADDEILLTTNIVSLASHYGRYGYRRITAMLRADGWGVNHKRMERIWRQEGLKVLARQPKRSRLWFTKTALASDSGLSIAITSGPRTSYTTERVRGGP